MIKAYVGESQARNRYTFYAGIAKKEGFEQISEVFQMTADNEKEHAETFFELIQDLKGKSNQIAIEAMAPLVLGSTAENLAAAIAGEHEECCSLYPAFAEAAKKEGYEKVAAKFLAIASVEKHHEDRYKQLLELVKSGKFFNRDEQIVWVCRKCGYVHIGKQPPKVCPSCGHDTSFYQRLCENY